MYPIDAETILDIQRERQQWSAKRPTVNGYYWFRNGPESPDPQIVELWANQDYVSLCGSDVTYEMGDIDGEWSGPLTPPS